MRKATKFTLAIVGVILLLVAVGIVYFVMRPLDVLVRLERRSLARQGFAKSTIEAPTGPMTVWEVGTGPTLVLVHGAGDQAGAWEKVTPALVSSYRVLIPDLPGHGESAPASGPLTVGMELAGMEALVAGRGEGSPVVFVGNSFGAWLALLYAQRHPGQVARVVAVNGGALRGERRDLSLMPADRQQAQRLMDAIRDPGSPAIPGFILDDIVRQTRTGPIARLYASAADMENYLLDGRLGEVQPPVEILWGEADQLMGTAYARKMEAQLPAARLTLIPRCGHVPMRECPTTFTAKLIGILREPPPSLRPAPR